MKKPHISDSNDHLANINWLGKDEQSLLQVVENEACRIGYNAARLSLKLKQKLCNENTALAIDIVCARKRAGSLSGIAGKRLTYFTGKMLEQATSPELARYHASRFRNTSHILEIGTGAGFDTVELSRVCRRVTTVESDPIAFGLAKANFQSLGLSNIDMIFGKSEDLDLDFSTFDGLWADPSRRNSSGDRIKKPVDYKPSLPGLISLPIAGERGIKLSPAVDISSLLPRGWGREWIGYRFECKEQVVWANFEREDSSVYLGDTKKVVSPMLIEHSEADVELNIEEVRFLVEPHPALIRSGLISRFYKQHGIKLIDPQIAYGVSDVVFDSEGVLRFFEVLDVLRYKPKVLRKKLHELQWGRETEIKTRGFPITPEEVRKDLKLSGQHCGVIILTRRDNYHLVFLCVRK